MKNKVTERAWDRNRVLPSADLLLKRLKLPGLGYTKVWSQRLLPDLPCVWQGPK